MGADNGVDTLLSKIRSRVFADPLLEGKLLKERLEQIDEIPSHRLCRRFTEANYYILSRIQDKYFKDDAMRPEENRSESDVSFYRFKAS